jgi:glutamyl-tRNA synthetase
MRDADDPRLVEVLRVCSGFRTFADVLAKAGFLFIEDGAIAYDPQAVKKVLAKNDGAGYTMLETLKPCLASTTDWTAAGLDALIQTVCAELKIGMGNVAQPLRVAVSGTTISPAIGETLGLLGRNGTLARIRRCIALRTE